MRKQSVWLIPFFIVTGCSSHYSSNPNLPPRSDEPSATKASLAANDPTVHEKRSGDDEVEVAEPDDDSEAKDRKITENVRTTLDADASLSSSARNVTIVTAKGVVTLRGTVATKRDRELVAEKAESVSGVKRVENKIEVAVNP